MSITYFNQVGSKIEVLQDGIFTCSGLGQCHAGMGMLFMVFLMLVPVLRALFAQREHGHNNSVVDHRPVSSDTSSPTDPHDDGEDGKDGKEKKRRVVMYVFAGLAVVVVGVCLWYYFPSIQEWWGGTTQGCAPEAVSPSSHRTLRDLSIPELRRLEQTGRETLDELNRKGMDIWNNPYMPSEACRSVLLDDISQKIFKLEVALEEIRGLIKEKRG